MFKNFGFECTEITIFPGGYLGIFDQGDIEMLKEIFADFEKHDIDELIKFAIDTKHPEFQVFLMHYKNEHFPFDDDSIFDQYKL